MICTPGRRSGEPCGIFGEPCSILSRSQLCNKSAGNHIKLHTKAPLRWTLQYFWWTLQYFRWSLRYFVQVTFFLTNVKQITTISTARRNSDEPAGILPLALRRNTVPGIFFSRHFSAARDSVGNIDKRVYPGRAYVTPPGQPPDPIGGCKRHVYIVKSCPQESHGIAHLDDRGFAMVFPAYAQSLQQMQTDSALSVPLRTSNASNI